MSILPGLQALVREGGERMANAALQECRRRTAEASPTPNSGRLAQSIQVDPARQDGDSFSGTIRATAEHASYTDTGTGVHAGHGVIRSRSGGPLVFYWITGPDGPGVYHFMFVQGQPGQFWFARPMPDRWRESLEWASQIGAFGRR